MEALKVTNKTTHAYGKSFASFGEIAQGRKSDGTDFLITVPINLWSTCRIDVIPDKDVLLIDCQYPKSKLVAEMVAKKAGVEGYKINVGLTRSIPIGKGLSSSTADMLAVIRAFEAFFNFSLSSLEISDIFQNIEPHDGLMYNTSVIYNHRKGILLQGLDYTPKFKIIYLDFGGIVDSIDYNKHLIFSTSILRQYDCLYDNCVEAYKKKDDQSIAECAVHSLSLSLEIKSDQLRTLAFENFQHFEAMGVINTHSGTCIGFIYPKEFTDERLDSAAEIISTFYGLPTHITSSLSA